MQIEPNKQPLCTLAPVVSERVPHANSYNCGADCKIAILTLAPCSTLMAMMWFSHCSEAKHSGVGPAEAVIMFPLCVLYRRVLSPHNVYCLVVNAPRETETLQADGQVTWGAPGSGRKTFPSHREWMWLVRPRLSVCVQLKQETARRQRNTTLCMSNSYCCCVCFMCKLCILCQLQYCWDSG